VYSTDQLFADTSGYGTVVAVYDGQAPLHVQRVGTQLRRLDPADSASFLDHKYCQVVAGQVPHVYRVWDTNETRTWAGVPPREGAFMLGKLVPHQRGLWVSPMRPTNMVDYRQFTALKHTWNRADFVLDASLASGVCFFAGRAAPQSEMVRGVSKHFTGGAVQIFLPRDQFGYLRLNTWWAVQ